MGVVFVLDTNTVIYLFRGEGDVADHLMATPPADVAIPDVVLYELEVGALGVQNAESRLAQLARFVDMITVLPFGEAEAKAAAEIRVVLAAADTPIGPHDTLIAATALTVNGSLVTRNQRAFVKVPGLTIVDWYG